MATYNIASLRRHMGARGFTRRSLAAASGVSEATIRRIEAAEGRSGRARVERRTAEALAGALDVDVPALEGEPEAEGSSPPANSYSGVSLDLAGTSEAAEIIGVSRQRVNHLRQRHPDFPPAVDTLSQGPVWLAEDIRAFARMCRPGGRPEA